MQYTSTLHKAAIWYATTRYHIFPCRPGTKIPATTNGLLDATTDTDQVDRWWRKNPHYNIGIACGPSNLVVVDFDTYKSGIQVDSLFDDDDLVNSVMSLTPRGGTHVWFKQSQEARVGSHTDKPRQGIDIRADGGYIMAPPSSFAGHGLYTFVADHKPTDVSLDEVPAPLLSLLASQPRLPQRPSTVLDASEREIRDALGYLPSQGDYGDWCAVLMAVHSIYPDETGVSICEEWSPGHPGEVAKKFKSFRKTGKTIATLFGMARAHGWRPTTRAKEPDDAEAVRQRLRAVEVWARSGECIDYLKDHGIRRSIDMVALLVPLLHIAIERGNCRIFTSTREFSRIYGIGYRSVARRIERLNEVGVVKAEGERDGTWVDLSPLYLDLSVTPSPLLVRGVTLRSTSESFQARHAGDDAFAGYPYWYAAARRNNGAGEAPLMASLGASGWLLWDYFVQGGTIKDVEEGSHLSRATVRAAVTRFMSSGLMMVEMVGREKYYRLKPGAEEMLDSIRPHMVTFGVNQMRNARSHADASRYAELKLRGRRKMVEKDIAFWERVRNEEQEIADRHFDWLDSVGFDARKRVGKERAIKLRATSGLRFDAIEEWRSWGRPLFDAYNTLGEMSPDSKVRRLTLANMTAGASVEQFREFYLEMREKVRVMMRMAPKRVQYERRADWGEAEEVLPKWRQLEMFEVAA